MTFGEVACSRSDAVGDTLTLPAWQLARLIKSKDMSVIELIALSLRRIEQVQATCNAFTEILTDESLQRAKEIDTLLASETSDLPLLGLPITVKDFTPSQGHLTTRGSIVFRDNRADHDAVVVQRLKAAGAIIVAKTTTPEFAHSGLTQSNLWGITRNPWDISRSPGGSSGGAAVSVVTGCAALAEGSDMGGSVRIPASFSGCVGLKPSKGRIPMDLGTTVFDHIAHFGPMTRCVEDAALFLSATEGPDGNDIQSQTTPVPLPTHLIGHAKGLRIAASRDLGIYNVAPEIIENLERSVDALRDAGATVDWVDLNWPVHFVTDWETYWGVYLAAQFGEHLEVHRAQIDPELVMLIEAGLTTKAIDIERGAISRTRQWHDMVRLFARYDALICPTTARTAPEVEAKDTDFAEIAPNGRMNGMDMTAVFNNVGVCPAIAVPNGVDGAGLPTSVQIVANRFDDPTVLRLAKCLQDRAPWQIWQG